MKKFYMILFLLMASLSYSQENKLEGLSAAPNPFINSTTINFTSTNKVTIIFSVKNVLGKTVFKQSMQTKIGKNTIPFSKGDLRSGIYIYSLQYSNKITSKRLIIK